MLSSRANWDSLLTGALLAPASFHFLFPACPNEECGCACGRTAQLHVHLLQEPWRCCRPPGLLKLGRGLREASADVWCVCLCICLRVNLFSPAGFSLAVMPRSFLAARHPLVLLVLLVGGSRFPCLTSSVLGRPSCSLLQFTICYLQQQFSSPFSVPHS